MNIFLSQSYNIRESVQDLDNVRLNKQAVAIKEKNGEAVVGHKNHPVYAFYKSNPDFLAFYGLACCTEYKYRTNKNHLVEIYFSNYCNKGRIITQPPYEPYYMDGSKNTPECIRTKKYVSDLFQAKLIKKWLADKKPPNWGNRAIPSFFEVYINKSIADREKYWQQIENIKKRVKNENICE